jgi:hypothetical protein
MQVRAEAHDTAYNEPVEGRLGVGWIDHRSPFQRSASVGLGTMGPIPPTAVHVRAVGHETASKMALGERLGAGWIDHLLPFHRSTSAP